MFNKKKFVKLNFLRKIWIIIIFILMYLNLKILKIYDYEYIHFNILF